MNISISSAPDQTRKGKHRCTLQVNGSLLGTFAYTTGKPDSLVQCLTAAAKAVECRHLLDMLSKLDDV